MTTTTTKTDYERAVEVIRAHEWTSKQEGRMANEMSDKERKAETATLKAFADIGWYCDDDRMDDHQRVTAIRDVLNELKEDLTAIDGEHPMGWT